MSMIEFQRVTFTYPGQKQPALQDISFHIPPGELCLVMGPSGAGKSTLLRCINGLVPHFSGGTLVGNIRVGGLDPVRLSPREMSRVVGFVFQDPESQFVVDRVEDELAFSLENLSQTPQEMEEHINEVLRLMELTDLRLRRLDTLSGGERQRVAIASALVLRPRVLVLDEPTSQLDPHAADDMLLHLLRLNKELNLTIVLAEHRIERILPYTGQIIYLSDEFPGGLSGEPRQVLEQVPLRPPIISLGMQLGWQPLPLTVDEAQKRASAMLDHVHPMDTDGHQPSSADEKPVFIEVSNLRASYGSSPVLHGVDVTLHSGEIAVLMGPNGSGKTTLLRCIVGLTPYQEGVVRVGGQDIAGKSVADICQQVGYLPQDPNALLFADSALDELAITLKNHHFDLSNPPIEPHDLLTMLCLEGKEQAYPRDLSAGERQRVALGAVTVTRPGALLLDEPTRGLDYDTKQTLLRLLRVWKEQGMAILLVTHDVELAAQAADRVILLEQGRISAQGDPVMVLPTHLAFSPQVAQIFPGSGWLTVEDAVGGLHAGKH